MKPWKLVGIGVGLGWASYMALAYYMTRRLTGAKGGK
jgi:hypothetical protein